MSILSFLVNLVSLYLFHGIKKHDHSHKAHKHTHNHHDCESEHLETLSCHDHSHEHIDHHTPKNTSLSMIHIDNQCKNHCNHNHNKEHHKILDKPSMTSEIKYSLKNTSISPIDASQNIQSSTNKPSKKSHCKEKIFNQKKLNNNQTSEKIMKGVKSSLDITSKGLLSVFLIGDKIIESSKNALSSKKDDRSSSYNFPEEKVRILDGNATEDMNRSANNPFKDLRCSEVHNKINKAVGEKIIMSSNLSKEEYVSHSSDNSSFLEDYEDEDECDTGHIGHCHSHDMNFTGMLIHLIGDVVSSLCVIISSIVVVKYNWIYFDSICSIIICIFIILSTAPLNYIIFKKMRKAFSVTQAEEKYITLKIEEVKLF